MAGHAALGAVALAVSGSVKVPARRGKLPTGIRRTATGWRAYVWVKDPTKPKGGYQAQRRYPPDTPLTTMREWRMKAKLGILEDEEPASGFADDAREYLSRDKVQKMPTCDERHRHIAEWIAVFRDRDRHAIQPQDIQKVLDRLRSQMSAGSVNKRRTALMDLWTILDGRHQANPVKATKEYAEPEPEPRAPELALVLKILKAMPTKTDYGRKCQARLAVIAWTGWPHTIVKQLEPTDLPHWKKGSAFVKRRKKGKGARARWLPLLPEAVKALRAFHKADAYGPFSNSTLHKRLTAVCVALKVGHVRPYDFRHFFGTLIATITRDERAVQELMLLSTVEQARRYTAAATDPRVQAAVAEVADRLPGLRKAAGRIGRVSRPSMGLNGSERTDRLAKTG